MQLASIAEVLEPVVLDVHDDHGLAGHGVGPPSLLTISSSSETSTSFTVPTVAPATRTSSPSTTKAPLSKIPRTS